MIPPWTERNLWVKNFISENVSVVDWGCGNKDILRYINPSKYLGIDRISTADVVADFNIEIPTLFSKYDIGLVLGVLEYLNDPEYFLKSIKPSADTFIILCLSNKRKKPEWKNNFSAEEFNNLLIPNWKRVAFTKQENYILGICRDN